MIETKQLLIFRAVVDAQGFTKAGHRLGLSQPAISQQIRALERTVGVELLLRMGTVVRPTPAGEILLDCARQVLDKLDDITRVLGDHGDGSIGVIRLGAPEPACIYLLPSLIIAAKQEMSTTEVRTTSGQPIETLQSLGEGRLDMALLPLPVEAPHLRITEVGRDELVAVVLPGHPWTEQRRVKASDFNDEPIVLYDRRSPITERTLRFLLEGGVFPKVAAEIQHLEAVKQMVLVGVGVAVLPWWSVRREVQHGLLASVQLGNGGIQRSWGVVYPEQRIPAVRLRAFIRLCTAVLPPLMAPGVSPGQDLSLASLPRGHLK
jgi:DNA-binding transcriptional LysR family regulator